MAVVLCTGVDRNLIRTRVLLLEGAGHEVHSAMSESELVAACGRARFDVAVFGQAASAPQKRRFLQLLREHCPSARVLELYSIGTTRALPDADAWLEVPAEVPQDLAARVAALAASR